MTVITEKEYFEMAKELFIDLMKKVDQFAFKNNLNTEKLLCINCIYHICNKLPKEKEKIINILEHCQNIKFNQTNLEEKENDKDLYNKKNKFYKELIEFIIERTKEIEKYVLKENPELTQKKDVIEGKKANFLKNLKKEASKKIQ